MHGLQLLLDRRIPFYIKGALWPPSADKIAELHHWTHDLMRISTPPSHLLFLDLRHRRDSKARNRQIEKLRLSPQEAIRILASNPAEYRTDLLRLCRYIAGKPSALLFTCNAGNRLCIDAYGRIQYCLALRHPDTVVDSRSHCIRYYLNEFLPELRKMRATNQEYLKRCARCMLRGLCEQCPAKSWIEHGVLDQPVEYCCEVAHAQARWLGILKEDEYGWEVRDWMERVRRLEKSA